jgi:uncharacterized protein (DUF305 family)
MALALASAAMRIVMKRSKQAHIMLAFTAGLLALGACGGPAVHPPAPSAADRTTVGSGRSAAATEAGTAAGAAAAMPTGDPARGPHNAADVRFATLTIYHHAQAIQLADLVLERTTNPKVTALARRIKAAQARETAVMSGWLKGWQVKVPALEPSMAGGMPMAVPSAQTSQVDAAFLTVMQQHCKLAIAMAKRELTTGSNPEARRLAQSILRAQTAEVAEMKAMLRSIT